MFASTHSAFSPIAPKGAATLICSLQSLSLCPPRARVRDRIPSPWPASARAERRALAAKPIRFKKKARKPRMAHVPVRKAAPTAFAPKYAHPIHGWIEKPAQDDDLPPIVVEWSPPPMVSPINQSFEC